MFAQGNPDGGFQQKCAVIEGVRHERHLNDFSCNGRSFHSLCEILLNGIYIFNLHLH